MSSMITTVGWVSIGLAGLALSFTTTIPALDAQDPASKSETAELDGPLPEGWPGPTTPGTIEIKKYPGYRSAILRQKDAKAMNQNTMFYPLLSHIERKDIAMTVPVVMTYADEVVERTGTGEVAMEFLYRRPTQGTTGPDQAGVVVEDRPATTVVSLGLKGYGDAARLKDAVAKLRAWIEEKPEWVVDGQPRELVYHGPSTPKDRRLFEIQIPVKPTDDK